jgi:hypothetical protein
VRYVTTSELKHAVDRCPLDQKWVAALIALHAVQLSSYLHGRPFGKSVRTRLERLCEMLDVDPAVAIVPETER